MFANSKKPPPAVRTVTKVVKKTVSTVTSTTVTKKTPTTTSRPPMRSLKDAVAAMNTTRKVLTPRPAPTESTHSRPKKRKKIDSPLPTFASDSSDDDEGGSSPLTPLPLSKVGVLEDDPSRRMRDTTWTLEGEKRRPIIHGRDLTTGDQAKNFVTAFPHAEHPIVTVELQYPSNYPPEKFDLVLPIEKDGYSPLNDIESSIEVICQNYFPPELAQKYTNEETGFHHSFRRALARGDLDTLEGVLEDFNSLIKTSMEDGTIQKHLDSLRAMPLMWYERIFNQSLVRTVSPQCHLLNKYENGTANVYGELLPRFCHEIFRLTNLKSNMVFVDLGSGVGNVALQAALECGAEAWGIEMMDNPATLGAAQLLEFEARCKRWGLTNGRTRLVHGDFTTSRRIDDALKRADVILINNKAFPPSLNDHLLYKFLDFKEGVRIVSLVSFVPSDWKITDRNEQDPRNMLRVERKLYGTKSVSWSHGDGEYFISTKDSGRLRRFQEKRLKRG